MKIEVLKELPDGTPTGAEIDVSDDIANVLILVGAARKIVDSDAPEKPRATRRAYQRRDLEAETD